MAGIFNKFRLLGLSNLNTLLDKAIDLNSVGAVEQHLRDLMSSRDTVDRAVAESIGRVRGLEADKGNKARQVAHLDQVIRSILTDDDPTNDAAAKPKAAEMLQLKKQLEELDVKIQSEGETRGQLTEALTVINGKVVEMEGRLETLRSTEGATKAKEEAASALQMARRHLESGAGSSVDSALKRAENRGRTAGALLEGEMGRIKEVGDADDGTEVDLLLAGYKRELASPKPVEAGADKAAAA